MSINFNRSLDSSEHPMPKNLQNTNASSSSETTRVASAAIKESSSSANPPTPSSSQNALTDKESFRLKFWDKMCGYPSLSPNSERFEFYSKNKGITQNTEVIKEIQKFLGQDVKEDIPELPFGLRIVKEMLDFDLQPTQCISELIKEAEKIKSEREDLSSNILALQLALGKIILSKEGVTTFTIVNTHKVESDLPKIAAKEKLQKQLDSKILGSAEKNENCFYDSFLQALPQNKQKDLTIAKLKLMIADYLKQLQSSQEPLKQEELREYENLIKSSSSLNLVGSVDEFIDILKKSSNNETNVWGNEAIDGKILAKLFNVNLVVHEVKPRQPVQSKHEEISLWCFNYDEALEYKRIEVVSTSTLPTIEIALYNRHFDPVSTNETTPILNILLKIDAIDSKDFKGKLPEVILTELSEKFTVSEWDVIISMDNQKILQKLCQKDLTICEAIAWYVNHHASSIKNLNNVRMNLLMIYLNHLPYAYIITKRDLQDSIKNHYLLDGEWELQKSLLVERISKFICKYKLEKNLLHELDYLEKLSQIPLHEKTKELWNDKHFNSLLLKELMILDGVVSSDVKEILRKIDEIDENQFFEINPENIISELQEKFTISEWNVITSMKHIIILQKLCQKGQIFCIAMTWYVKKNESSIINLYEVKIYLLIMYLNLLSDSGDLLRKSEVVKDYEDIDVWQRAIKKPLKKIADFIVDYELNVDQIEPILYDLAGLANPNVKQNDDFADDYYSSDDDYPINWSVSSQPTPTTKNTIFKEIYIKKYVVNVLATCIPLLLKQIIISKNGITLSDDEAITLNSLLEKIKREVSSPGFYKKMSSNNVMDFLNNVCRFDSNESIMFKSMKYLSIIIETILRNAGTNIDEKSAICMSIANYVNIHENSIENKEAIKDFLLQYYVSCHINYLSIDGYSTYKKFETKIVDFINKFDDVNRDFENVLTLKKVLMVNNLLTASNSRVTNEIFYRLEGVVNFLIPQRVKFLCSTVNTSNIYNSEIRASIIASIVKKIDGRSFFSKRHDYLTLNDLMKKFTFDELNIIMEIPEIFQKLCNNDMNILMAMALYIQLTNREDVKPNLLRIFFNIVSNKSEDDIYKETFVFMKKYNIHERDFTLEEGQHLVPFNENIKMILPELQKVIRIVREWKGIDMNNKAHQTIVKKIVKMKELRADNPSALLLELCNHLTQDEWWNIRKMILGSEK